MKIFNTSYRWTKRPFANIKCIFEDIFWYGPKNVIRWAPVIWRDIDYDSVALLRIMEYKLRRLSNVLKDGHLVSGDRNARNTLIAAELCKRLNDDEVYYLNADKRWPKRGKHWAMHITYTQKQDQQMLGKIIGKYITHWWD